MLEAAAPVYMAADVPSGEERITRKRPTLDGIEFDKDDLRRSACELMTSLRRGRWTSWLEVG